MPRIFYCALVIICSLKEKAEFIRHQHYCLVFASLNCWRLRLTIDAQFTMEGVWNGPPRNGLIKIRWWHRAAGPNCLLTWRVSECTVLVFLDFLIRNFWCIFASNFNRFSGIFDRKILELDLCRRGSPTSKFCLNSSKIKREVRYQNFAWIQVKKGSPISKFCLNSSKIEREVRYQRGSLISKWGSPISKICLNSSKNDIGWIQISNYSKI